MLLRLDQIALEHVVVAEGDLSGGGSRMHGQNRQLSQNLPWGVGVVVAEDGKDGSRDDPILLAYIDAHQMAGGDGSQLDDIVDGVNDGAPVPSGFCSQAVDRILVRYQRDGHRLEGNQIGFVQDVTAGVGDFCGGGLFLRCQNGEPTRGVDEPPVATHLAHPVAGVVLRAGLDSVVTAAIQIDDVADTSRHLDGETVLAFENTESFLFLFANERRALDGILFRHRVEAGTGRTGDAARTSLAHSLTFFTFFTFFTGSGCARLLSGGTENVQVRDHQGVARIDPVRVGDVAVGVPELRPQKRVL